MSELRKITHTDPIAKRNATRYSHILQDFEVFAHKLSLDSGRVKISTNKARSYVNHLVYLTVLYEEVFQEEFGQLDTFNALKKIKRVQNLPSFRTLNKNYFYSATINCFAAYLTENNSHEEIIADDRLNLKLIKETDASSTEFSNQKSVDKEKKKLRPNKKIFQGVASYPRDLRVSRLAKEKSKWSCEIDTKHRPFISQENGKNFVEAHHLVPMAVQDYFDYTLDFTDNVTTLCPNCHRLIHYAEYSKRKEIVTKLYNQRKSKYSNYGIEINKSLLLSFYGVVGNK